MQLKKHSNKETVGSKIQRMHTQKRITLDAMANNTGFPIDCLKKIEAVEKIPPVGLYRTVFNAANDAIFVYNLMTRQITDVNTKGISLLHRIFGESSASTNSFEFAATFITGFLPETSSGNIYENLILNREINDLHGQKIWLEINLKESFINDCPHLLSFVRDISQHKLKENESNFLRQQLQQVQKMETVGVLASGIAHDFNNILACVMGYTEISSSLIDADSQIQHYLSQVITACRRAKDLISQILTYCREGNIEKKPIRINLLVKEVISLLRASVPSNIEILTDITQAVLNVCANPIQIHQVIMNLCTNAAYAMRTDAGTLEIRLHYLIVKERSHLYPNIPPGKYAHLIVRDTGCGIPLEIQDKIFDPFFTTKDRSEGTGMGLSVTRGIVNDHGGFITVRSRPQKGATFNVYLPVCTISGGAVADHQQKVPRGDESILIIDDEVEILEFLSIFLRNLGYSIYKANSGQIGLALFKKHYDIISLVITDMTMPQMNGLHLAEKLLALRADIPIIMCSGYSNQIDEQELYARGIKAFLIKPVALFELAITIRNVLDLTFDTPYQ